MNKKTTVKVASAIIFPIAAVAIMLAVWSIAAASVGSSLVLPSLSQTLSQLAFFAKSAQFYLAAGLTALRGLLAFVLSFVAAGVFASLALICRPIKIVLDTIITGVRAIPTISVILIFIIWFSGFTTPIFVTALVIFPALYSSIRAGLAAIDPSLEETANIYALNLWQKIFKIYIPLCAPIVLEAMASNISLAIKLTIAAELLAQTSNSLGILMQQSQVYFETARLFALTVAAIVISVVFEGAIRLVKKLTIDY